MFKGRQPDGRFVWINPRYVVAVIPGLELGQCQVITQVGPILLDGVSDEIGESIAKIMFGVEPAIDESSTRH